MNKASCIGIKEAGKPFREINLSAYRMQLDLLPPGKYQTVTEKYKRKATHQQFKYLYGVVYPLSLLALINAGYEFVNIDDVDVFWKRMFANKEILNRETGEIMILPLSKSQFKTIDEMAYCDSIRNYCSEYLNTNVPDPETNWKQHEKTS